MRSGSLLNAEIAHAVALLTYDAGFRCVHLVWRGWHFLESRRRETRQDFMTSAVNGIVTVNNIHRRSNCDRFNKRTWVIRCLAFLETAYAKRHLGVSYDDIPWEVHAIEDLQAYLTALVAYKENHT